MTPGPGIAPGAHWWEASALTTAPSLLPLKREAKLISELLKLFQCVSGQFETICNPPRQVFGFLSFFTVLHSCLMSLKVSE